PSAPCTGARAVHRVPPGGRADATRHPHASTAVRLALAHPARVRRGAGLWYPWQSHRIARPSSKTAAPPMPWDDRGAGPTRPVPVSRPDYLRTAYRADRFLLWRVNLWVVHRLSHKRVLAVFVSARDTQII